MEKIETTLRPGQFVLSKVKSDYCEKDVKGIVVKVNKNTITIQFKDHKNLTILPYPTNLIIKN